jgi:putative tricarboxylic transport membrane protein
MGELLSPLVQGFGLLGDPVLWLYVLAGTIFGVIVGALPGIGATLGYGLVLPFTFVMSPVHAVAMLLSISVGNQYGNSIPAILMGLPGSPAAVMTVIDGHLLMKRGEGSAALGVAFVAALGGQLLSIVFFVLLVVPLSGVAYLFLAPEIFALYLLGMVALVSLTGQDVIKGFVAIAFGLGLGLIGLDPINNVGRFDFGVASLRSGLDIATVMIGLLAVSELFRSGRQVFEYRELTGQVTTKVKFPPWRRVRPTVPAMLGGTVIGTLLGAVPGAGTTPATLVAYQQAKLWSKHPEEFGHGSLEGIAANEAAQNASNSGELVPTLALGIPVGGSMVILLGALTVQGFVPGPSMVREAPELLYATIAGMLAATILLLATGWYMGTALLKAVGISRSIVIVLALAITMLGVYALRFRIFDVFVCLAMGLIGYFMHRYAYPPAAAALAVVLGSEFERNLRTGHNIAGRSWTAFLTRPYTMVILAITLGILALGIFRQRSKARKETSVEAQLVDAVARTGHDD